MATELSDPAQRAFAITPHDSNNLAVTTRGLYIGAAGNISVILADDTDPVTFTALAVGVVHPLCVKRVRSTSTTATGIIGLY